MPDRISIPKRNKCKRNSKLATLEKDASGHQIPKNKIPNSKRFFDGTRLEINFKT